MRSAPRRAILCAAIATALTAATGARAVRLDPDGLGQALIFPYYTVQSARGNALNTYLSVVNHGSDAKAIRVRFHEGRMGAEVADFNLFLSPNDVWTAALVPTSDGTRLLTVDHSCTEPAFTQPAPGSPSTLDFNALAYSGIRDDSAGNGLDRTREGYFEMIEMATLTGTAALAVTHTSAGVPANCAYVQGPAAISVAAPSGSLSGSLTIINVANGMEFSTNAVALTELATRPFFRPSSDAYPDWNAAEIDPVSAVVANGAVYRSVWSRPVDAVSAVLMRSAWQGEYVLDNSTQSLTDLVITFPTRRFYVNGQKADAPFTSRAAWSADCGWSSYVAGNAFVPGETISYTDYDRESRAPAPVPNDMGAPLPPPYELCATSAAFPVVNGEAHMPSTSAGGLLGSRTGGILMGRLPLSPFSFSDVRQHGWLRIAPQTTAALVSSPSSSRIDAATGAITSGAQTYRGLPIVGFTVRSYTNGTLTCTAGQCQGNYGGAFPLEFERAISP